MKSHPLRVGAVCLNQTPLDWSGNRRRILDALEAASEQGCPLACLPELCVTGYTCEDAFSSRHTLEQAWETVRGVAARFPKLVFNVGLPVLHHRRLYNTAALVVNGKVRGLAAKQFLAGEGVHYEPRWFSPWTTGTRETWRSPDGGEIPIGDLCFDIGGLRLGFEICEDAWVADRPGTRHASHGVDVIFNPSASHFAFGKRRVRENFVLDGSRAFHAAYVYANLLGNESGRLLFDGGAMIASGGELLATGPRFGYEEFTLTHAVVDLVALRMKNAASAKAVPVHEESRPLVRASFDWPETDDPHTEAVEAKEENKREAFTRMMTLGLFDYIRKSRSRGAVVSLSGGSDSASVLCLLYLMVRRGPGELGEGEFARRLGMEVPKEGWMKALITTVYQSTAQSGDETRGAARTLAEALDAHHVEWDVEELVRGYVRRCEEVAGRPLTWEEDDIPLQNIQARARAPGVWMLANMRNALLLSTSNRSEAAVGYATMDGDTCGGLCPLSGIDKNFLLGWLKWLEVEGLEEIGPVPALEVITSQRPTAELRPATESQSDENDLMPYDVLDAIEKAGIRDKRSPADVLEKTRVRFPEHSEADLRKWVVLFFRLWSRNQWKRERYAPGFHVDDENLDPKTWCRWPILSGGFADELKKLEADGGVRRL